MYIIYAREYTKKIKSFGKSFIYYLDLRYFYNMPISYKKNIYCDLLNGKEFGKWEMVVYKWIFQNYELHIP